MSPEHVCLRALQNRFLSDPFLVKRLYHSWSHTSSSHSSLHSSCQGRAYHDTWGPGVRKGRPWTPPITIHRTRGPKRAAPDPVCDCYHPICVFCVFFFFPGCTSYHILSKCHLPWRYGEWFDRKKCEATQANCEEVPPQATDRASKNKSWHLESQRALEHSKALGALMGPWSRGGPCVLQLQKSAF